MARNLNYNASGSKCYGNQVSNCDKYGRLYDWATAMNLPSSCNSSSCSSQVQAKHRGICPEGWHIPSDSEWTTLTDYVGGSSIAGKKLKSTNGWNTGGSYKPSSDDFGFAALPGGLFLLTISYNNFYNAGNGGYWWSAGEEVASSAYRLSMDYYSDIVYGTGYTKACLFSVRCVQDNVP
jgi:uncharacterized protein (TIGR02145 family)